MTAAPSFWQRVSNMFKGRSAGSGNGDTAALERESESGDGRTGAAAASRQTALGKLQWTKSGQAREVSLRVVELADAMQAHFWQQDQRAEQLAASLNRVGEVLEQLAQTQREQGACLRTIAQHSEAANRHVAGLSDTMARVPESLLAQAEAVQSVARQVEKSHQTDAQLLGSIQQFGKVVDALGHASNAQVETLRRLNDAQAEQSETFARLVTEQGRRQALTVIISAVVVVASLAAVSIAVFYLTR